MRVLGFALMGAGLLIVLAAFAPQLNDDTLRYALTALGPCVGGIGAWLRQAASGSASAK
jgi:hypothetical protein